jgi:CIC family chloride channel protein
MSSNFEGLALLALLGLICGLLTAGVIALFRFAMDFGASQLLPFGDIEGFEGMSRASRFWLCVGGGLLVGILLNFLKATNRSVGVVHVIERLEYHQGHLPLKNAMVQFVAGGISLLSGHSVGREGPSVHLGAAASGGLGRMLRIPNNSVRVLIGCGVAAAIAAAFNTPLAGVIFAMEVVIMEYSVIGFTPIIVAAVSATTLTRLTFGDDTAFTIPAFEFNAIQEIPIIVIMGALIGCISALFIQTTIYATTILSNRAIWIRTLAAGVFTGTIALLIPQIMGTGYDTVDHILLAQIGLGGVILLTLAKMLTTAAAIGLGIPAGLIGPSLFIGAAAGAAIGLISATFFPGVASPGFYAMLGMAAMMAATLQAPLAALIYLLEISTSQQIILPGMAAVVSASLVTRIVFKKSSIYQHLMSARGLDYLNNPMSIALRKIGVAGVMDRDFHQSSGKLSQQDAKALLKQAPRWIILNDHENRRPHCVLPLSDLARHINEVELNENDTEDSTANETNEIDLFSIPAKRLDACPIEIVASLQEAHEKLQSSQSEVLFITGAHGATKERVYGVVSRDHIESAYYSKQS